MKKVLFLLVVVLASNYAYSQVWQTQNALFEAEFGGPQLVLTTGPLSFFASQHSSYQNGWLGFLPLFDPTPTIPEVCDTDPICSEMRRRLRENIHKFIDEKCIEGDPLEQSCVSYWYDYCTATPERIGECGNIQQVDQDLNGD